MVPYLLKSDQYWPRNDRKTKPNIKQYAPRVEKWENDATFGF